MGEPISRPSETVAIAGKYDDDDFIGIIILAQSWCDAFIISLIVALFRTCFSSCDKCTISWSHSGCHKHECSCYWWTVCGLVQSKCV